MYSRLHTAFGLLCKGCGMQQPRSQRKRTLISCFLPISLTRTISNAMTATHEQSAHGTDAYMTFCFLERSFLESIFQLKGAHGIYASG